MTAFIITYAFTGLLTGIINTYQQLYEANKWPPANWRSVSLPAVAMVIGICTVLWPAVWPLMWIDKIHTQQSRNKRKNQPNKGKKT